MGDPVMQETADPFTPGFDAKVEALLQEYHVPGMSIAIVHGEKTFSKAYGFARVGSSETPAKEWTPHTRLGTASTTKAFTALALAQIVHAEHAERHKDPPVTWQTPVSTLLPLDFVLPTRELTEAVTIEDILCHRSGVPSCDNACLSWGAGHRASGPRDTTRKLRYFPLPPNTTLATLRTRSFYSNTMYGAAEYLVETLQGRSLHEILQKYTFDVLGMDRTVFGFKNIQERPDAEQFYEDQAKGYRWAAEHDASAPEDKDKGKFVEVPWRGSPEQGGAGDIISCVTDYALWMRAVLSRDTRLVNSDGWKELLRPRVISETEDEFADEELPHYGTQTYALGWNKDGYRGKEIISHSGGDPGISTLVHLVPAHDYGIAMFANTSDTPHDIMRILSMQLTDDLLAVPAPDRLDWPAIVRAKAAKEAARVAAESFASQALKLFPPPDGADKTDYPRVALSVPLRACAGRFRHAAYDAIAVEVRNLGAIRVARGQPPTEQGREGEDAATEVLFVSLADRTFPSELVLRHHNAGFFVTEEWDLLECKVVDWLRAEVRVGPAGEVGWLGVVFEGGDVEEPVWFEREEDGGDERGDEGGDKKGV